MKTKSGRRKGKRRGKLKRRYLRTTGEARRIMRRKQRVRLKKGA